jgi:hypothetical protein
MNKMTNILKMQNDVLLKQEVVERGAIEGLFWGLSALETDPVSLLLSNKGSTEEPKHGEESGEKGAIDPFCLFK